MKKYIFILTSFLCVVISCDNASSGNKNIIPTDPEQNIESHNNTHDSLSNLSGVDSIKSEIPPHANTSIKSSTDSSKPH